MPDSGVASAGVRWYSIHLRRPIDVLGELVRAGSASDATGSWRHRVSRQRPIIQQRAPNGTTGLMVLPCL